MALKVSDDRRSGWLKCPAGDPVCRDPPACGNHMGFICRGFCPLWVLPEFDIKLSLGAPLLIFPHGYLLKSFQQGDTYTRQQGFEIGVFPILGERPSSLTCLFACNTPGNSVPTSGLHL